MMCTSSHKNCNSDKYTTYSISGNRGRDAGYTGKCYPALAPKLVFWKIWHENIGIIPEEENNRYYIEQYYQQVLSKLDPEKVYRDLDGSILLCYEDSNEFCHRHIVAAWLEIFLGVTIYEVKCDNDELYISSKPKYIKEYLSKLIMENYNKEDIKKLYLK